MMMCRSINMDRGSRSKPCETNSIKTSIALCSTQKETAVFSATFSNCNFVLCIEITVRGNVLIINVRHVARLFSVLTLIACLISLILT